MNAPKRTSAKRPKPAMKTINLRFIINVKSGDIAGDATGLDTDEIVMLIDYLTDVLDGREEITDDDEAMGDSMIESQAVEDDGSQARKKARAGAAPIPCTIWDLDDMVQERAVQIANTRAKQDPSATRPSDFVFKHKWESAYANTDNDAAWKGLLAHVRECKPTITSKHGVLLDDKCKTSEPHNPDKKELILTLAGLYRAQMHDRPRFQQFIEGDDDKDYNDEAVGGDLDIDEVTCRMIYWVHSYARFFRHSFDVLPMPSEEWSGEKLIGYYAEYVRRQELEEGLEIHEGCTMPRK